MIKISNFRVALNSATAEPVLPQKKESPASSVSILKLRTSGGTRAEAVLSVTQFAAEAGVTPQAVRKMIAEGRIQATKIGNQHSIPNIELIRYLQIAG